MRPHKANVQRLVQYLILLTLCTPLPLPHTCTGVSQRPGGGRLLGDLFTLRAAEQVWENYTHLEKQYLIQRSPFYK